MIAYYFSLQIRRIHRMVIDMGLHPVLNYSVIAALYLIFSASLFSQKPKIVLAYSVVAIFVASIWNDPSREDFLKTTFIRRDYYLIRLSENLITVFPFVLGLCISANFLPAIGILVAAILMAIISFKVKWQIVLPTPFYSHPFEFIIGFRLSLWLYLIGCYLTYISISYANFGIGVFVIVGTSLLCSMFYSYIEDVQYVWIYTCKAKDFLHHKLFFATLHTQLLCLPIVSVLIYAFPSKAIPLVLFQVIGLLIVILGVLAKYTSYPNNMKLRDGWLMFFGIIFPPLLLFVIPFFYIESHRQLKEILP